MLRFAISEVGATLQQAQPMSELLRCSRLGKFIGHRRLKVNFTLLSTD
jgi:hypothetical protein